MKRIKRGWSEAKRLWRYRRSRLRYGELQLTGSNLIWIGD